MEVRDLIVEVRDANLNRVGQIVEANLPGLKLVQRFNNVGTWEITLPADDPIADELRAAGAGIIATGDTGVLMSGFTTSAVKEVTPTDPVGAWKIQGVDDSVILGERLAYPTPATADVTLQTTETDARSGLASTVMYQYVDVNIGPSAPVARKIPFLTLAADAGLGSTVYKTARFRVLGEVLSEIGSIDPIGFRIQQSGSSLEFSCYSPTDRTGEIRLDVVNDTLSKSTYGYGVPSVTRAIVGGTGQGTSRTFLEVSDTESLAAETLWGRRIETFVDQNNESDTAVLNQAGLEKIADGGRTGTSVSVLPSSDLTMAYGRDWYLGDRVTVVVGGQEVSATVTEAAITVSSDGIRIGATVGDPSGVDFDALITKRERSTPKRLNAAELKEAGAGGGGITEPVNGLQFDTTPTPESGVGLLTWNDTDGTLEFGLKGGNVTLQIGQEQVVRVKNNTGATIGNGSAVYISSSDGVNFNVTKALADSDANSAQTLGITTEDLANGQHGFVTTFGLVRNIDTSGLTEGGVAYLSGTVAGGLTATKPTAPTHMVSVGHVLRAHATVGVLFVRVQNGYELDELHDVAVSSPASGDLLQRNGSGLWVNRSLSAAGVMPSTAGLDALSDVAVSSPASGQVIGYDGSAWINRSLSAAGISEVGHGHAFLTAGSSLELSKTSTQNITTGTQTTVTAWTVTRNVGGFSYANGVVTIPTTGRYSVSGLVQWAANATGYRMQRLLVDGGLYGGTLQAPGASVTHTGNFAITDIYLTSGQTLEFAVFQNSGSTLAVGGTTYATKFCVTYLGT